MVVTEEGIVHQVKTRDVPNLYKMYQSQFQKEHVEFLEEFMPQFVGIFGVDKKTTESLFRLLYNGTIEYLTSPACNG